MNGARRANGTPDDEETAVNTQKPTDVTPIENWSRLLDGKIAVVTGGGDGIGGAISRLFAQHGAQVEIAEIDPDRAARAVADIEAAGGIARAHIVDVTKEDDVAKLAAAVLATHDHIDVLVNNGRLPSPRALRPVHTESWKQMYDINLFTCSPTGVPRPHGEARPRLDRELPLGRGMRATRRARLAAR
jgi:NAD(P)-dependent dehydrogenase (short-subunit alcohol dehydrogenase family)